MAEVFQRGRAGMTRGFSPEQQEGPLRPNSQVCQAVHCEVLAPTQRLTEVLESGGEAGAGDPLKARKNARKGVIQSPKAERLSSLPPLLSKEFR